MKTLRDILLQRHRSAEPKLDRIRKTALDAAKDPAADRVRSEPLPVRIALNIWREIILPSRRAWATLACIWVGIIALNRTGSGTATQSEMTSNARSTEMLMVWREQQRILAEVTASPVERETDEPKAVVPRRRSDGRSTVAIT